MRPALPFRLAVLLALLLSGPSLAAEGAAVAPPVLPAITVAEIRPAHLVQRIHASGMIVAVEEVLVSPQIEGQAVESIEAEVGDWVAAGAVLARLSDAALKLQRSQLDATRASAEAAIAQAQAQLLEAEAMRDEALRERDRAVKLSQQGVTSTAATDTARSNAATAMARTTAATQARMAAEAQLRLVDAQIADVELQLRRTAIVAPVAGRVTGRAARLGAIAAGGAPLFSIMRDGALELRADVAEQDVLALAPGQKTTLRVVGRAEPIPGEIRLVEPTVDADTRLGRVRIGIDAPDMVRAGMFAEAEIEVRAVDALAAPVSAVRSVAGGAEVYRVRDGVVEITPIVAGIRDGALVEVVSGLAEGDLVVAKSGAFVRDGDRINPVPARAAEVRP